MNIKINTCLSFYLIIISLFFFPYSIRERFFPLLKDINIFFYLALFIILYKNKKCISKKNTIIFFVLMIYNIFINIITDSNIKNIIYFNIQTILPLCLLLVDISKTKGLNKIEIQKVINFYNICILIYFLILIIDIFFDNGLSRVLANNLTRYPDGWIEPSVHGYRYRMFFAHPLQCSVLVMIFYILNISCQKNGIKTNLNYWVLHIITGLFVFLLGSKTVLVLFIFLFLVYNAKPKQLLIGFLFLFAVYLLGGMNFILNRFIVEGLSTSGRNEAIFEIARHGFLNLRLFTGYGENLQYILHDLVGIARAGAAMEYPILVYVWRYGFLFGLLLVYILFINPLLKIIKTKHFFIFIGVSSLILQLSMFNGLIALVEVEIEYVMFIFLIENLILYLERSKKLS